MTLSAWQDPITYVINNPITDYDSGVHTAGTLITYRNGVFLEAWDNAWYACAKDHMEVGSGFEYYASVGSTFDCVTPVPGSRQNSYLSSGYVGTKAAVTYSGIGVSTFHEFKYGTSALRNSFDLAKLYYYQAEEVASRAYSIASGFTDFGGSIFFDSSEVFELADTSLVTMPAVSISSEVQTINTSSFTGTWTMNVSSGVVSYNSDPSDAYPTDEDSLWDTWWEGIGSSPLTTITGNGSTDVLLDLSWPGGPKIFNDQNYSIWFSHSSPHTLPFTAPSYGGTVTSQQTAIPELGALSVIVTSPSWRYVLSESSPSVLPPPMRLSQRNDNLRGGSRLVGNSSSSGQLPGAPRIGAPNRYDIGRVIAPDEGPSGG